MGRRLGELSSEDSEPYGWEEFRRRAGWSGEHRPARHGAARRLRVAALALGGASAVVLLLIAGGIGTRMREGASRVAAPASQALSSHSATADSGARAGRRPRAGQPAEPALVRVGSYAAVAGLEDQIEQLDQVWAAARARGARPASLSMLEAQRARLEASLMQVRYAEDLVAQSEPIR